MRCSSTASPARRPSCAASARCSRPAASGATRRCFPGHGTTPQDLERTRWQDWAACVAGGVRRARVGVRRRGGCRSVDGRHARAHLAAHDLRVRAVATLAAPIWLSGPLPPLLPVIKRVVRWHRAGDDVDLWHPDAVEELYSYGIRPTRSIDELRRLCAVVRKELAEIRAPVLVLHGERDRSIDPRCAREIARRLDRQRGGAAARCCLAAATRSPSTSIATASTPRSCSGSSASPRRRERPRPRDDDSAGIARGFQQPRSELRVDDGVRRRARVEVAMTFRGVALRRLRRSHALRHG